MIFGILLSLLVTAMPLIIRHVYARAVAATTPPPFVLRALPQETPALPMPAEVEQPEPDEWDVFMGEIRGAVESGRLRL